MRWTARLTCSGAGGIVAMRNMIPRSLSKRDYVRAILVGWLGASLFGLVLAFSIPGASIPLGPITVGFPFGAAWLFLLPFLRGRGFLCTVAAGITSVPIVLICAIPIGWFWILVLNYCWYCVLALGAANGIGVWCFVHAKGTYAFPGCAKCGYNLTSNVSGDCPECGTAILEEHWKKLVAMQTEAKPIPTERERA